jgi:catechol 2,3-dioxygenase-like lactoylglutathione lyase family enzyme
MAFEGLGPLGQIHVSVTDFERSVAFYRDALGLRLLFQVPDQEMAFFDCGGVRLYLGKAESPEFRSTPLLYFRVADIDEAHRALLERGVRFTSEPHVVHRTHTTELHIAFFTDPDGTHLALMSEVSLTPVADRDRSGLAPSEERRVAVSLFNGTWAVLERGDRTAPDDLRMLHMAHASRFHWGEVGEPVNLARGEWLCSHVYAVLGRAEPARFHAERSLRICEAEGIGDFDLAYAHEALARAARAAGDDAAVVREARIAQDLGAAIADPEDRGRFLADLADLLP